MLPVHTNNIFINFVSPFVFCVIHISPPLRHFVIPPIKERLLVVNPQNRSQCGFAALVLYLLYRPSKKWCCGRFFGFRRVLLSVPPLYTICFTLQVRSRLFRKIRQIPLQRQVHQIHAMPQTSFLHTLYLYFLPKASLLYHTLHRTL